MSKPNPAIVEAIFDSYLTIRDPLWKLTNEDHSEITVPEQEKARLKAKTTVELIDAANKCKTIDDWVNYVAKIHAIELKEMQEGNDRWFIVKWVTDIPLLGHTLTAVRAYILDQIKDEKYQTSITAQLGTVDAFKSNVNYHIQYFQDIIRRRDHRGLNEKSFDDFAINVACGRREAEIAELLLSKHTKPERELEAQRAAEAAENARRAKEEEEARRVYLARLEAHLAEEERQRAEKQRRDEIADKARREDDERRALENARRLEEEERKAAEKAKREEENRRRAAEMKRIHDEEEIRARERADAAAIGIGYLTTSSRTPRARRNSVKFDPSLFSSTGQGRNADPMEIDPNYYPTNSTLNRRTSRRGNG